MKKIPTLFERIFEDHKKIGIKNQIYPGMEWVMEGEGIATEKLDGSCCAIINGTFYKRYDAKKGKVPPIDAIACDSPDPVTGHWPFWVKVDSENPNDCWFYEAYKNSNFPQEDATFEAIGPHFQGNPYHLEKDVLEKHGIRILDVPRTFEGIKEYLKNHYIEGIVFWKDGKPECKIKRSDFGFTWK